MKLEKIAPIGEHPAVSLPAFASLPVQTIPDRAVTAAGSTTPRDTISRNKKTGCKLKVRLRLNVPVELP